jgi:beta-lactamase superfamily II metal-dependent hydrolase
MKKYMLVLLLAAGMISESCSDCSLRPWKEGYLDIHQISTGRGNATFMILPDGTTMMVDMGDLGDTSHFRQEVMPAVPSSAKSPAQWVARYVRHFSEPLHNDGKIDYMLITHYDSDHIGAPGTKGVSELDTLLHIEKIVDRGYDYPTVEQALSMNRWTLPDYLKTLESRAERGLGYEKFVVGSDCQFALIHQPRKDFKIRNIYANGHLWTGDGLRDVVIGEGDEYTENLKAMNENRLSCTINISYGDFDYHNGGDIQSSSINSTRPWRNVEKFVGEFIGETDVVLANHHAYSDAMYEPFLKAVTPQVCILPVWDYYHPQPSTLYNMLRCGIDAEHPAARDSVSYVFSAGIVSSNRERLGDDGQLILPDGHVVVRVYKGGRKFRIFVLDDRSEDYNIIYRTPMLKSRK